MIARGCDVSSVDINHSGISVAAAAAASDACSPFVSVGDDESAGVSGLSVDIEYGTGLHFHFQPLGECEGGSVAEDEVGCAAHYQRCDADVSVPMAASASTKVRTEFLWHITRPSGMVTLSSLRLPLWRRLSSCIVSLC